MYPHTITIYHKESTANADTYERYVLDGAYVNSNSSLKVGSVTFSLDSTTRISLNKENLENFNVSWKLTEGDRIVQGIGPEMPTNFTFAQLEDAFTVTGYKVNQVGSNLDGIVIDCK